MKYIRTNDARIIENKCGTHQEWLCGMPNTVEKYYSTDQGVVWQRDILKQANTIEELCDEFVYAYKNMTPFVSMVSLRGKKLYEYEKDQFLYATKECKKDLIMYGAIWTDKGLIYVAKMNDKGELVLL